MGKLFVRPHINVRCCFCFTSELNRVLYCSERHVSERHPSELSIAFADTKPFTMGMPVYDLSGMESIFRSSYLDASISLASCAAQARAYQRCQDLLLHEVLVSATAILEIAMHRLKYVASTCRLLRFEGFRF